MTTPTHIIQDMTSIVDTTSFIGPDMTLYRFEVPLQSLNGKDFFARSISKLPRPGWPGEFASAELVPTRFLQVGGSSDAMTLEVRKEGADGAAERVYKLGHSPAAEGSSNRNPSVEITLGENVEYIYDHELFKPDEAARIFYHYYRNDEVPEGYILREIM